MDDGDASSQRKRNPLIPPRRKRGTQVRLTPWRDDPIILKRIALVEALYLESKTEREIAAALEVSSSTVHKDITRLRDLWLEQAKESQEGRLTAAERRLRYIQRLAFDDHQAAIEGRASLLAQARGVEMDIAKLYGLIVEKNEHEIGPHTRRYIGVDVEDV